MVETNIPELGAREEHFRIPSHHDGLSLFLRYLPPLRETEPRGNVVLYVHGGIFHPLCRSPIALMVFRGVMNSRHPGSIPGDWISTASAGSPIPIPK
jgi:hypothetical protein